MLVCLFASVLVCVSVFACAFSCLFGVLVCRVLVVSLFTYSFFVSSCVCLLVRVVYLLCVLLFVCVGARSCIVCEV